jgi:hypothetical protein
MQQFQWDLTNTLHRFFYRITTELPDCVAHVVDKTARSSDPVRPVVSIQDLMSNPTLMEQVAENILTKEELHKFLCTNDRCYQHFLTQWIELTRSQQRFGIKAQQMDAFQREVIQGLIKAAIGSHQIGCLSYRDFLLKYLLEQEILGVYLLRALTHAQKIVPVKETPEPVKNQPILKNPPEAN